MTALFCILTLAGGTVLYAQGESEGERTANGLKRYHALVNAYWQGDDGAVKQILDWDPKRLSEIIAAAQSPLDIFEPWNDTRLKAAAMLHTDAAILVLEDDSRRSFQLSVAIHLLQMGGVTLRPFSRTWYMTVTRVLRDRVLLFVAQGLLEGGRKHLPGDAVVLYESGVLEEHIATFAAFFTETVTELPSARSITGSLQSMGDTSKTNLSRSVLERRRSLDDAARWLRESLKADPSSELTRLHLGRIQFLRANYDEASKLLQPLAASAVDTDVSYLATMFLGASHERRRRYDEAEQMYRRAIEKIPASQSAHIALSEVLQKLGRGDQSREVLIGLLRIPANTRTEPWWWYLSEAIEEARERVDALRASVRK